MENEYTLYFVENDSELEMFWRWRDSYMTGDILPNATFNPISDEEKEWFFSKEYKEHIIKLFHRETDTLRIVYLQKDGINIGFAVYVIYHSEDSKCFIIDFCISTVYRNKGIGTLFFEILRNHVLNNGAEYFALNLSNQNNERFWLRNGFVKAGKDEYGIDIYEKRVL